MTELKNMEDIVFGEVPFPEIVNDFVWPFEDKPAREVQLDALKKGYGKEGFAYFMRQRLGKTLVAYGEFVHLRKKEHAKWMFVICPNSIKEQWEEQILEVDVLEVVFIYEANKKAGAKYFLEKNPHGGVFIINYESMKIFMNSGLFELIDHTKVYLVADESTKIKEPTAKVTKACHDLSSLCMFKRVLAGKPSAGSNADLWSQLKFIGATHRNFYQHKYTFTIVGGFQGRQSIQNLNTDMLKKEIAPYVYIAPDKYLVGFEKVYEPMRRVNLTGDLLKLYKKMQDELIFEINADTKISAPIVLTQYLRLQQISSGIAGDIEGNQHNLIAPEDNPRIRNVVDIIDNEISGKTIIICRFRLSAENLFNVLTDRGHKCAVMVGGMGRDLNEQKKLFTDGDHNILVAQEQVLNFGHTLCGPDNDPCLDMIHYESSFSLINRAQCESRPEKMGRNKPISHWDFFASKMDRYILQSLLKKEDGASAVMGYARKYGIRPEGLD